MNNPEEKLQRHYSTVGIGDVFVGGTPFLHPLPMAYLATQSQMQDFDSCEIVGKIKASPEDFVVQEIPSRNINIPGVSIEDESKAVDVADLSDWDKLISQSESSNRYMKTDDTVNGTPSSQKDNHPVISSDTKVYTKVSTQKLQDDATIVCKQSQIQLPSNILNQLSELHNEASSYVVNQDHVSSRQFSDSTTITMDPADSYAMDNGMTDSHVRGALHQEIRAKFPLLQSETQSSPGKLQPRQFIHVSMDDRFFAIAQFLMYPAVDLLALYKFFKRGCEGALSAKDDGKNKDHRNNNTVPSLHDKTCAILRLSLNLPRSDRAKIHQMLLSASHRQLDSSTVPEFPLHEENTRLPDNDSSPCTTAAIVVKWSSALVRKFSRKRKRMDASSAFVFVLKKRLVEHLGAMSILSEALRCSRSDIGFAGIKDMQAVTYQFCTVKNVSARQLATANPFLEKRGMQIGMPLRVNWTLNRGALKGNRFCITVRDLKRVVVRNGVEHFVPLDKSHWERMAQRVKESGFVNFFGEQRVGIPGTEAVAGVRAFDIGRAVLQQNYAKAIDLLMTGRNCIRGDKTESDEILKFREVWKSSGGDPKATWSALPRNNTLLREKAVLKGLKRFGSHRPLEAFRCLHPNEQSFFISAYQSLVWNSIATERLQRHGFCVAQGDLVRIRTGEIVHVTDDSISQWTIFDVLLPLPGTSVEYPSNSIGDLYKTILEKDQIGFSNKLAKGGYRNLISRAENMQWHSHSEDKGSIQECTISFDLGKGCYATMVLREIMATTIDRA